MYCSVRRESGLKEKCMMKIFCGDSMRQISLWFYDFKKKMNNFPNSHVYNIFNIEQYVTVETSISVENCKALSEAWSINTLSAWKTSIGLKISSQEIIYVEQTFIFGEFSTQWSSSIKNNGRTAFWDPVKVFGLYNRTESDQLINEDISLPFYMLFSVVGCCSSASPNCEEMRAGDGAGGGVAR